jgi:glycerol-3-phosphate acyltransferase PlsY
MNNVWFAILWSLGAYLVGSLSFGDLVARAAGVRIREVGTGNPGAANVWREIGPRYGSAVLVMDYIKGALVTLPLYFLGMPLWVKSVVTGALLLGHFFPVFWRFRGGTGMAAGMGAATGFLPLGSLVGITGGLSTLGITRNTGRSGGVYFVATVIGGVLLDTYWLRSDWRGVLAALVIGVVIRLRALVQYRHR